MIRADIAADNPNPLKRPIWDGAPEHANLPIVRLLLEKGADADKICDYIKGLTVLRQAVTKDNKALVILLLEHGAKISASDMTGMTTVEYDEDGYLVELLTRNPLFERHACQRDLICAARFFISASEYPLGSMAEAKFRQTQ